MTRQLYDHLKAIGEGCRLNILKGARSSVWIERQPPEL